MARGDVYETSPSHILAEIAFKEGRADQFNFNYLYGSDLRREFLTNFENSSSFTFYVLTRINDIAIAMSYSSRADPGLRVAF